MATAYRILPGIDVHKTMLAVVQEAYCNKAGANDLFECCAKMRGDQ